MDVKLPNGKVIKGVPDGTSRDEIMQKAISAGLATEADFQQDQGRNQDFTPAPSTMPEAERSFGQKFYDFFTGKEGERGVFAAPELNEMSLRAFKAGLGGLLEGDPTEIQSIIASNYPEAEFGEMQGQPAVRLPSGDYFLNPEGIDPLDVTRFGVDVAAFTPAGRVTGATGRQLLKGAAVAGSTQAGLQATEAATGGTFDPEDVALEAGIQGTGQLVEAGARAALPKVKEFGGEFINKIKQAFSKEGPEAPYENVAKAITSGDAERVLPEIMADPEVMRSAEELGINVNPGVYSTSDVYREMENSLKTLPGSRLSENEKQTLRELGQRADELIQEYVGTTDKSAISGEIGERIGETLIDMERQADELTAKIDQVIPPSLKIYPENTLAKIRQMASDLGGTQNLDPKVRRIFSQINEEGGVNYALLEEIRKDVGSAFSNQGPFKDASKGQIKALYGTLTDDTMKAGEFFGIDDVVNQRKDIVKQRKSLEDLAQRVLGRDLSRSIMSELGLGVRRLQKGEAAKFDDVLELIPPDMRQTAAISALNDIFAGGARTSKDFSLSGFVNSYQALKRNKAASDKLFRLIPNDVKTRLDNIYRVSKGLVDQNQRDLNNPSGTARAVIGAIDAPDGVLSKLYKIGRGAVIGGAATSPFDSGLSGATVGIYDAIRSGKNKATEAADAMLASNRFKEAMQRYIDGNPRAANRILASMTAAQEWIKQQPAEVKRSIARQGIMAYLLSDEEEE